MFMHLFGKVRHGPKTNPLTVSDDQEVDHSVVEAVALVKYVTATEMSPGVEDT